MSIYRVCFFKGALFRCQVSYSRPPLRSYYGESEVLVTQHGALERGEMFNIELEASDEHEAVELARDELEFARLNHTFS